MTLDKQSIIDALGLVAHPEGGHYRETFRAELLPGALPGRGPRACSTAIYFLLAPGEFSAFHRVLSDEVWHHYKGGALELLTIDAERRLQRAHLGTDLRAGELPQLVVRAGVWQAARPLGDEAVLCGCTVAPGFDFADFSLPPRGELIALYPEHANVIATLTRG
jgi:uncharacterized protein